MTDQTPTLSAHAQARAAWDTYLGAYAAAEATTAAWRYAAAYLASRDAAEAAYHDAWRAARAARAAWRDALDAAEQESPDLCPLRP